MTRDLWKPVVGLKRQIIRPSDRRRPSSGIGLSRLLLLVLSAYLMALSVGSGRHPWLGVLALLPLLRAIQVLRPVGAMVCGGVWGGALYAWSVLAVDTAITPGFTSLLLLTTIPGLYACCGAWTTRRLGFSPAVLAFGWMLMEFAFRPLGLSYGLLGGTQAEGLTVGIVGRLFGYVLVAFLVAYAGAMVLAIWSRLRFRLPRPEIRLGLEAAGLWLWQLNPATAPCFIPCPSNPRAPPAA